MSNSGDNNAAQNAETTQNGGATLPTTDGPPETRGPPSPVAAQPAQGDSSASGDFPSKAPMPDKGSWPLRVPRPQADEDRKKTLQPPYEAPKIEEGQLTAAEYAALSPDAAIAHVTACAAKDAAVKSATLLYPDDPTAAAIATSNALTGALKNAYSGPASSPGGAGTASLTPQSNFQSKLAQEAVLAGIIGNTSDGVKFANEGNQLFKNAKLMPIFPGIACKTQPDVWEDYWEKVLRLRNS